MKAAKSKTILFLASLLLAMTIATASRAFNLGSVVEGVKDTADVVHAFTIGDKEEVEIGGQIHPQLLEEMGGSYDNKAVQSYVNSVGQKLVKKSKRSNIKYTFTVVNADYVNAFAIPGGYVYVTKGILGLMNDEAELAAVLGHEIGHVVKKHGLDRIKQGVLAEKGGKYSGQLGGEIAAKLTNVFANLAMSGYGRGQEAEADTVGLENSNNAGYDPEGAVHLFEHLLKLEKGGSKDPLNKFFASHPDTKKRIEAAKKEIKTFSKKGKAVNAAEYKKVQKKIS